MNYLRNCAMVKRYHTVPTIGNQTTGEHSFHVALLLTQVCEPSANLLKAALFHDLAEFETGDVPAQVKRNNPDLEYALTVAEDEFMTRYQLNVQLSMVERALLKWADIAELVFYCLDQITMGNRHLITVCQRGLEYLGNMPFINAKTQVMYEELKERFNCVGQ